MKEYNNYLNQQISAKNKEIRDERIFEYEGKEILAVLIKPTKTNTQPYYIVPGIVIKKVQYGQTLITNVEPIPKEKRPGLEIIVRQIFSNKSPQVNFWDN